MLKTNNLVIFLRFFLFLLRKLPLGILSYSSKFEIFAYVCRFSVSNSLDRVVWRENHKQGINWSFFDGFWVEILPKAALDDVLVILCHLFRAFTHDGFDHVSGSPMLFQESESCLRSSFALLDT